MRVAIQGCSHGSLSAIYDTIAQYTARTTQAIDLLLLCGDFQALRSSHDFASLAVPPKYHSLGTFHQYYSGARVAPVLTIVIGGNHEASNYMWELYHGGWLAPGIWYLGAAGSVNVGGWRIVGASGIYKDHDYRKGHFETVPYNNSTLRSVYHIREYDVERLKLASPLSKKDNTIVLSHDWPTTIPNYGDTSSLLRRKPFFAQEVQSNTLGSPPLLELMKEIRAEYWFSAHLHVKFAAVFEHLPTEPATTSVTPGAPASSKPNGAADNPDEITIDDDFDDETVPVAAENPDEIAIDDDDFDEEPLASVSGATATIAATTTTTAGNPDEITIGDDFDDDEEQIVYQPKAVENQETGQENGRMDSSEVQEALKVNESADLVAEARKDGHPELAEGVIGASTSDPTSTISTTQATVQAASSEGVTKFLALDKCGPGKDFIQFIEVPSPPGFEDQPVKLTYDPEWLAITRATHAYLSLKVYQNQLPPKAELERLVEVERKRIREEGLLVPRADGDGAGVELVWDKGEIEVERVQKFWPTAPAEGQPGGSSTAWYTNPQTEAFCGMLGIPNKINPAPVALS